MSRRRPVRVAEWAERPPPFWKIGQSEDRGFESGPHGFEPPSIQTSDFKIDTYHSLPSLVFGIIWIGQSLRIMRLSGIAGHGTGAWCSSEAALLSCHECVLSEVGTAPPGLVSQLWSTASYLTGSLLNSSGAIIVTILSHVPFSKCASSNYKATRIPRTYMSRHVVRFESGVNYDVKGAGGDNLR